MENITATFTHPSIPQNKEEPTFEAIRAIHKLLNQNDTGILCGAYGNTFGVLGLTITPAAYHTLAGANFVMPIRPAPPVIPPFASNVQVIEIMRIYNESLQTYSKYVATAKALKTQLLGAFHENYFLAIYNQATGYEANNNKICADYNPTAPIEKYIAR
eukprot:11064585-Ditylum_brightwellii.AAC.1